MPLAFARKGNPLKNKVKLLNLFLVLLIALVSVIGAVISSASPPQAVQAQSVNYPLVEPFENYEIVVTFPDPNVEAAIREAIGKPTGDIYRSDLEALTELHASDKGISDLTGLEYCVNLQELCLEGNLIGNLQPLANLINLHSLDLDDNEISDSSPLSSLINLAVLKLGYNQIDNLSSLSSLTNLTELHLMNNEINDVSPLSSLTNLSRLWLTNNQISQISSLSSLTSLTYLMLGNNEIGDISPLVPLSNLNTLQLAMNAISDISPLSSLTSLTWLDLISNQISDISPLTPLANLTHLFLSWNQISDISTLSSLTNLTNLWLQMNQISDLSPLSSLVRLTHLILRENHVNDILPISSLTNLAWLDLTGNQISDLSPLSNLRNLVVLHLGHNQITDVSPIANLTNLGEQWCQYQPALDLSGNQISDISPLVQNEGLDEGDEIDLRANPLSADSLNIYIPQLQARGVNVLYDVGYAIIVAGQGGWAEKWSFDHCANNAYKVLRNLGFNDDHIYYLNSNYPQDIDGDGDDEIDAPASVTDFENSLNGIRASTSNNPGLLVIYLMGHGDGAGFLFDPSCDCVGHEPGCECHLSALGQLKDMLSEFSNETRVLIFINSCYSGCFITFINGISEPNRIIITSTHNDQERYAFAWIRSSDRFWGALNKGLNVREAFTHRATWGDNRHMWLDDNGDRVGHPPNSLGDDGELAAATQIGVPGTEDLRLTPWQLIGVRSPCELRVYDSQNQLTGLVNGEVKQEIPNSIYDEQNEIVAIFSPFDTYRYEVAGTEEETYGLDIASIEGDEATTFAATDIPTASGAVHQYTMDWDALSEGEEGATVQVDSDGDGMIDCTFNSNATLTQEEFIEHTRPVGGTIVPTDKLGLAMPWILAAALIVAAGVSLAVWNRKRGAERVSRR
ncbi:hypothetical protein ES703_10604 [subsurface metagenome]